MRSLCQNRVGRSEYLGTHYLALVVAIVLVASFFLFPLDSPTGYTVSGDNASYTYEGPEQITFTSTAVMDLDEYFTQSGLTYLATSSAGATVSVSGSTLTLTAQEIDTQFNVTVIGSVGDEFLNVPLTFSENDALQLTPLAYPLDEASLTLQNEFGVNEDAPTLNPSGDMLTYSYDALDLEATSRAYLSNPVVYSDSVKARMGKFTDEPALVTQVFALENVDVDSAQLVLAKYSAVEDIYKCDNFDTDLFMCAGTWYPTPISFNQNSTHVWFVVDEFSAYGGGGEEGSDNLYDCASLDTSGTTYTLMNDVGSSGDCFDVTADNVVVDCNGFTVSYAASGSGAGFDLTGRTNVTLQDCVVSQGSSASSSPAVRLSNTNSSTLNGLTLTGNSGLELSSSSSNTVDNTQITGTQTGVLLSTLSSLNEFTDVTVNGYNAVVMENSANNVFEHTDVWGSHSHLMSDADADGNLFRNTDFVNDNGKVTLSGEFFLPADSDVDHSYVSVEFNDIYVNSDDAPYLNMPGEIVFYGLEHLDPQVGIDRNDDNNYADCEEPECSVVSNDVVNKVLRISVEHFTSYMVSGSSGGFGLLVLQPSGTPLPTLTSPGCVDIDFNQHWQGGSPSVPPTFTGGGVSLINDFKYKVCCPPNGAYSISVNDGSNTVTLIGQRECGGSGGGLTTPFYPGGGRFDPIAPTVLDGDAFYTSHPHLTQPDPLGLSGPCPDGYSFNQITTGGGSHIEQQISDGYIYPFPVFQGSAVVSGDLPIVRSVGDTRGEAAGYSGFEITNPGSGNLVITQQSAPRNPDNSQEAATGSFRGESGSQPDPFGQSSGGGPGYTPQSAYDQFGSGGFETGGVPLSEPRNPDQRIPQREYPTGYGFESGAQPDPLGSNTQTFEDGFESGDTSAWSRTVGSATVTGNRITGMQTAASTSALESAVGPSGPGQIGPSSLNEVLFGIDGKVLEDECSCTVVSILPDFITYILTGVPIAWVPTLADGGNQYAMVSLTSPDGTQTYPGHPDYPSKFYESFDYLRIKEITIPTYGDDGNDDPIHFINKETPTGTTIITHDDPNFQTWFALRYPPNDPVYAGGPTRERGTLKPVDIDNKLSTTARVPPKKWCGDGAVNLPGEECDGGAAGGGFLGLFGAVAQAKGDADCAVAYPGAGTVCDLATCGCVSPAPGCGDGVWDAAAEDCEKGIKGCDPLFSPFGGPPIPGTCALCRCLYPPMDCDSLMGMGLAECTVNSQCEGKYGEGAWCSTGMRTEEGATYRDACKCYPARGGDSSDPGIPKALDFPPEYYVPIDLPEDVPVTPVDEGEPFVPVVTLTPYVPENPETEAIPPNPENTVEVILGEPFPPGFVPPELPPGVEPLPEPNPLVPVPPGTQPYTPLPPPVGVISTTPPPAELPLPPTLPILTPKKLPPEASPLMMPPPVPTLIGPAAVTVPESSNIGADTGVTCGYFHKDASMSTLQVSPVAVSDGLSLQGLPEDHVVVNTGFSLNCEGDDLSLSVGLSNDYTDLQTYRCTGGLCTPLDSSFTGNDLMCGDQLVDEVNLNRLNPAKTMGFEAGMINQPFTAITPELPRLDVSGWTFTFSPNAVTDTFGVRAFNPTSIPPIRNLHQVVASSPITLEFLDLEDQTLPLLINALYRKSDRIEHGTYRIYAVVGKGYVSLETYMNTEDGNLRAPLEDLRKLLNDKNQMTLVVLGTACDACTDTVFEKVYDGGSDEAIILVHGFASSSLTWNMFIEDLRMNQRPEQVWVFSYPSTKSIQQISDSLGDAVESRSTEWNSLNFVGHSLGGLVAQRALYDAQRQGRRFVSQTDKAIIVGSPNDGSPVAEIYNNLLGWMVNRNSFTRPLPGTPELLGSLIFGEDTPQVDSIEYEVLAGTSTYPFVSTYFSTTNDGITSVPSAQHVGNEFINNKCNNYFETQLTHTDLIDKAIGRRILQERLSDGATGAAAAEINNQFIELHIDKCSTNDVFVVVGKPVPENAQQDLNNCNCGNGICGIGENELNCPSDCAVIEEPRYTMSSWLKVLLMALVILIIVAALVFMLTRNKGGGSSRPPQRPPARPPGKPGSSKKVSMPKLEPLSIAGIGTKPKKKAKDRKVDHLEVYHDERKAAPEVPAVDKLMIKQLFTKKSGAPKPKELNKAVKSVAQRLRKDSNKALYGRMNDLDDIDSTLKRIKKTTKELESRIAKRKVSKKPTRRKTSRRKQTRRKTTSRKKSSRRRR